MAGVLITPETGELFFLGRVTVLGVIALALVACIATHTAMAGHLYVERSPLLWISLGVVVSMVISTLRSPDLDQALLGPYTRYSGTLPHIAYAAIFIAILRQGRSNYVPWLARVIAGTGAVVIVYGFIQSVGMDPVTWTNAELSTVFSTMGQSNFAAGYVAVALPLLVWTALSQDHAMQVRFAAFLVVLAGVVFLVAANSFQGPIAALFGLAPLAGVAMRRKGVGSVLRRLSRPLRAAAITALILGLALLSTVVADPIRDNLDAGFQERILLWEAAVEMARDEPLFGVGVGGYATEFGRYRAPEHASLTGSALADAPHSVPLRMLSEGGIALFLAYAAFVSFAAYEAVRALRRRPNLLTASVVGAWLAYQVQSLVSFDVPPLALMHWVVAGLIVLLARAEDTPDRLVRRHRRGPTTAWAPVGAAVAVTVVLGYPITIPLRADMAAENASEMFGRRPVENVVRELDRATSLAPWEGSYWGHLATVYQVVGDGPAALRAGIRAAKESPGSVQYAMSVAALADAIGSQEDAKAWYAESRLRDPRNAALLRLIAEWHLEHGRDREARQLLDRAEALER